MNWLLFAAAIYTPLGHFTWSGVEATHPARAAAYRYVQDVCGESISPHEFMQLPVVFAHLDGDDRRDAYFQVGTGEMSVFGCDMASHYVVLLAAANYQPTASDVPPQTFTPPSETVAMGDAAGAADSDDAASYAEGRTGATTEMPGRNQAPSLTEPANSGPTEPTPRRPDVDEPENALSTTMRWIIGGALGLLLLAALIFGRGGRSPMGNQRQRVLHWRYFSARGRANRREYVASLVLGIILFPIFGAVVLAAAAALRPGVGSEVRDVVVAVGLFSALVVLASAVSRRLHDLGFSGWLAPLALLPVTAPVVLPALMFMPGQPGANQYGVDPSLERRITEERAQTAFAAEEARQRSSRDPSID